MKGFYKYRLSSIHRPLVHYRYISLAAFVLLLIAFIIFLLIAISAPIVKTIYLLKVTAIVNPNQPRTNIATKLFFGVFGFCATRYVLAICG